ncbi:hypothetical protein [Compostibacter hankyongensis]|uniref:Addiction module protein n=1 Tax=Compostibacter hankyongensis TaxID=1007089 RepID=A0ABP8FG90_9BACT
MTQTEALRRKVAEYIAQADEKSLRMVQAILEIEQNHDWWDDLPSAVQDTIMAADKEISQGNGIPHEVITKKYKQWGLK